MSPSSILIVGTGAVGSLYGGKLAQAGAEVSVVCRSDFNEASANGISVRSVWGDFMFRPHQVARTVAEFADSAESPDYVLVCTKVLPRLDIGGLIAPTVGPDTTIVLLQNGIEIECAVAEQFPDNELISGLAFVCINKLGPADVHHMDYGKIVLGSYPGGISDACQRLIDLFVTAEVPCSGSEAIATARWKKLLWNAPFNTIAVLGGKVDTAQILACVDATEMAREVMMEVRAIAAAVGSELTLEDVQANIDRTLKMTPYKPSMLLDYENGREMETEAIIGNAVRAARREGVSVPRLESIYALLQLVSR
jgi:2-dehydropantoate 2-reductase